MAATTLSTSLVPGAPVFTDAERLALAGFLAGYRGLTREAYTLDLHSGCRSRSSPQAVRMAAAPWEILTSYVDCGPVSPRICPATAK